MGKTSSRPAWTWSISAGGSAWSSSGPTRFPSPSSTTWPMAPACRVYAASALAERVERSLQRGGPVGRSQGQAAAVRPGAVGRTAAAPVHRARVGRRARSDPDGRALLGAGSHRDAQDRGPDAPTDCRLHHRHRDPQYAAGRAGGRLHRLLHGHATAHRLPGGVRRHRADLHRCPRAKSPRTTSRDVLADRGARESV